MTDLMTSQLVLSPDEWRGRRAAHGECVHPFTSAFRSRRARGVLHPVHDFLFTYYTLSTSKLEQWHPGLGVELESSRDSVMEEYLHSGAYIPTHRGFMLAAHAVRPHHRAQLTWTKQLCSAVLHREPRFACHGLHEWAMVYRSPDIRHAYPLRLSADEVATVV